MGLQPRASASWRMLTPSRPEVANLCWATAQSRARNASTSAAERFLGMRSGVRRDSPRKLAHELEEAREVAIRGHEHARAEADRVEHGGVLGDEPLHEPAQVHEPLRVARARVGHAVDVEAHALPMRHGRAGEQHVQVLVAEDEVLGERVHAGDEAVLHERRGLDPILHVVLRYRHRVGIDRGGEAVERTEMLEVDPVRHGDPWIDPARPAEVRLVADLALRRPGNAGHGEEGRLAIEGPHEAPGLRARIGRDARAGRDLVARGDVHAASGAVEAPVMIGAADLPVDHLAHGKIGTQVRAEGALHHGPAVGVPVDDDAGAQEVAAHHLPGHDLPGQGEREPGLMKAFRRVLLLLRQGLGCAHGCASFGTVRSYGYEWTPYIYTVNTSSDFSGVISWGPAMERRRSSGEAGAVSLDDDPPEHAALASVVVAMRQVHGGAVVDDE